MVKKQKEDAAVFHDCKVCLINFSMPIARFLRIGALAAAIQRDKPIIFLFEAAHLIPKFANEFYPCILLQTAVSVYGLLIYLRKEAPNDRLPKPPHNTSGYSHRG